MSCGKIAFDNREQLRHVFNKGKPPRTYVCPDCNKLHVTTISKSEFRRYEKQERKKQKDRKKFYSSNRLEQCKSQYYELFGKELTTSMYFGMVNSTCKHKIKRFVNSGGKTLKVFNGILGAWVTVGKWPVYVYKGIHNEQNHRTTKAAISPD